MSKEKLVAKIKELLKTDADLDFLLVLEKEEIETLIACIRDRQITSLESRRSRRQRVTQPWPMRSSCLSRLGWISAGQMPTDTKAHRTTGAHRCSG